MRSKYMLIGVGIVIGVLLSSVVFVLAGNPDSPAAPGATNSFTLDDIWNRLDSGAAGAQSTFTEPGVAPGTGTMHTLNEIMAKAPVKDDANGATAGEVVNGKSFWGLNVAGGEWGLQTGTAPWAGVPKTGQTKCYTNTANSEVNCPAAGWPGQDGDHQKGVAWPVPRFTDNLDGTVTDNLTGLIWLQNANCANATRIWQTALNDVVQLNTNGQMNGNNCGDTSNGGSHQTDWRLPNVREMQSLVHYGVFSPAVPNTAGTGKWTEGDPFTGVQSYRYWSSTTNVFNTPLAFYVSTNVGDVYSTSKTGNDYYVWPVRGGQ